MRGSVITIAIVLAALIVVGLLVFSGNDSSSDQTQNQVPENNNQSTQPETNSTNTQEEINQPQTYDIEIRNYAFNPKTLTIKVGDTIKWTNMDNIAHTVTSDSGGELNSDYLYNGNWYSHTFTTEGTFAYHCRPHPGMKGTIVVG